MHVRYHPANRRYQTAYILTKVRSDCWKVSVPYLRFHGYFPQHGRLEILPIMRGEDFEGRLFVGDTWITRIYHEKKNIKKTIEALKGNVMSKEEIQTYAEIELKAMEEREKDDDIKMADYVRLNYRKKKLFSMAAHPTDFMYEELCRRVLAYMDIKENVVFAGKNRSLTTEELIYPCVAEALELEFSQERYYANRILYWEMLEFDKYIELYIRNCIDFDNL